MRRLIVISFVSLLVVLSVSPAAAIVSCHCFQDRSFDPARPEASDAYFLATTQNSLMAAAFNISRKSIVKSKMAGADGDLLWVAHYVSNRTGISFDEVFAAWGNGFDSSGVMNRLTDASLAMDPPFIAALKTPSDLQKLADGAYRSTITVQVGIDVKELNKLQRSGATRKEQVLSLFLSLLLAEEPVSIYASVANGSQSWGQVMASTGLNPKEIESSWKKLIKLHQAGL